MSGDVASGRTGPRRPRRAGRSFAVVLGFVATSLVVMALVGDRGLTEYLRVREEHRRLQAELAHAKSQNARFQEAVRRMRDDPTAIEELARRDLGLIKPGETLFIIRDVPESPQR